MAKLTVRNMIAYVQGHIRYKLYYTKYKKYIGKIKLEQIEARIVSMRPTCFSQGSCVECGCVTVHLQMSNKSCDGDCYPDMVNKKKWQDLKNNKAVTMKNGVTWRLIKGKFKIYVQSKK